MKLNLGIKIYGVLNGLVCVIVFNLLDKIAIEVADILIWILPFIATIIGGCFLFLSPDIKSVKKITFILITLFTYILSLVLFINLSMWIQSDYTMTTYENYESGILFMLTVFIYTFGLIASYILGCLLTRKKAQCGDNR